MLPHIYYEITLLSSKTTKLKVEKTRPFSTGRSSAVFPFPFFAMAKYDPPATMASPQTPKAARRAFSRPVRLDQKPRFL